MELFLEKNNYLLNYFFEKTNYLFTTTFAYSQKL